MIVLIVVLVLVILVLLTVYAIRKGAQEFEEERYQLFNKYAEKHGFAFSKKDTYNLQKKVDSLAGFGIAKIPLKNIIFIPTDHGNMYLFDQMKISGRNASSQRSVFTVCLIESKSEYGADLIINEAVSTLNANMTRDLGSLVPGSGIIELEDKAFNDRFIVHAQQPDPVKDLLNEDVRTFMLKNANRFSIQLALQIKGNMLAVHNAASSNRNVEKETDLEVLVDIAQGFPVS